MIDIREVRIGNLVLYTNKIIEIEGIKKNGLFKGIFSHDFDDCNGIPITIEYLNKFNFKNDSLGFFYNPKLGSVFLQEPYVNSKHYLVKTNEGSKLTSVYFVHQLQNIYYDLTGEQLTLNK